MVPRIKLLASQNSPFARINVLTIVVFYFSFGGHSLIYFLPDLSKIVNFTKGACFLLLSVGNSLQENLKFSKLSILYRTVRGTDGFFNSVSTF